MKSDIKLVCQSGRKRKEQKTMRQIITSLTVHLRKRYLLFVFTLIMLVIVVVNYCIMIDAQTKLIEHDAIVLAEIVTRQALTSRTVYTNDVAGKLSKDGFGPHAESLEMKGFVPLPAQFLKLVARKSSSDSKGLFQYRPLSKWNMEPNQGLKDDFQRWAWEQLEKQDQNSLGQPIEWKPVWRFEQSNNLRVLRYMQADAAANLSCVNCHNALEASPEVFARRIAAGIAPGKQWKQHQLLGAVEAVIPVDKIDTIAANQARTPLLLGMGITLSGFLLAAWMTLRDVRREKQGRHFSKHRQNPIP